MKHLIVALFAITFLSLGAHGAFADKEADKAEYQRKIDKKIKDLEEKIDQANVDAKEKGNDADAKIKEYKDKIAEIKRDSDAKLKNIDNDADRKTFSNRINDVSHNFHEWRFNRAISSYENKLADLKVKAQNETNADKKRELDEKVKKLETKNAAIKAKLADLKATNGDNWDEIERRMDESLKEIDQEYNAVK
jgi:DNA repair exonuclease SbcCD ATPase subunit